MTEKKNCFHCGDPCLKGRIRFDDKDFCCHGCKTVYDILRSSDMMDYYSIEKNPGNKNDDNKFSDFAFLEIPEIREKIVVFSDDRTESVRWNLPGIHCSSCIWLLERLDKLHPGVIRSEVNFLKKEAFIVYKKETLSLVKLAELLNSLGYPPNIVLESEGKMKARRRADMGFIFRLGIAGFAFGNIMLLSFPEYLATDGVVEESFETFFGYLNLILGLPVFFYCSTPYFSSAWKGLKHKTLNIDVPIALGILVLFIRSSYDVLSGAGAGYFDSMTGLVFFLLIGRWFQNRTYRALSFEKDYQNYFPLGVTKIENGDRMSVLLKDVHPGDHLLIRNNELIPADATIIAGNAFIDYSFVTGEAEAVPIPVNQPVFAGGRQKGGQIEIRIDKEFSQSYLMQLWKHQDDNGPNQKDLSVLIDSIAQYFTLAILLIAVGTGFYWYYMDSSRWIHAVTSILIIACPCALALTIPFSYGNALRRFEKIGLYFKDAAFVEAMSKITSVIFDKTGTITRQKTKQITWQGKDLSEQEKSIIKSVAQLSTHPLSISLAEYLEDLKVEDVVDFSETEGAGLTGQIHRSIVQLGSAKFLDIATETKGSSVHVKLNGEYKGWYLFENVYREGLTALVNGLKNKYHLEVMTGDNESEKTRLATLMGDSCKLHFNMTPLDKLHHIREVQSKGERVLMIGDGLNDAGAISESKVGISISDDIYGFLPACDAILESGSFTKIEPSLRYAKSVVTVVKLSFGISFLYNLVGMYFAIQGLLSPVIAAILMPLSSVTVAGFAVLGTNLAARSMFRSV